MSIYEIQPVALGGVKTYPIAGRRSKVSVREFARPAGKNPSLKKFLDGLPRILAGNDLRDQDDDRRVLVLDRPHVAQHAADKRAVGVDQHLNRHAR